MGSTTLQSGLLLLSDLVSSCSLSVGQGLALCVLLEELFQDAADLEGLAREIGS